MAITQMTTDWSDQPRIIRIVTTDNYATITAVGYLTAQATTIAALNNGAFSWQSGDIALIQYSGGEGFFSIDPLVNDNFSSLQPGVGILQTGSITLTAAQLIASYATPTLIIPAAGAHTWILMGKISCEFDYNTTQFTTGGAAGLQYGNSAHGAGVAASSTEAAATINAFTADNGFTLTRAATGLMSGMVNLGIYWSNATAAFAAGDGVITINYDYNIVSTTA